MKSNRSCAVGIAIVLLAASASFAGTRADLSGDAVVDFQTTMDMPFMTVGNPGNVADDTGFGAVDYTYAIGKFEVTAGQYTEFLNAVAATDTYELYDARMSSYDNGCKIQRTGSSGSYIYSVAADWEDRPVNWVSWGNAARFSNWLTNSMPTGEQNLTTTEDGSYFLNGANTVSQLVALKRDTDARYVIPTLDEWHKAAYHKNDGLTGDYFDYPTSSDTVPSNDLLISADPGNNATYWDQTDYTIDSPYWRTEAGEFENSASPYGTFDQGGNIFEWNESIPHESYRGYIGGSFAYQDYMLHAADGGSGASPLAKGPYIGFRVAEVPEPATMSLLAMGSVALLRRWRTS